MSMTLERQCLCELIERVTALEEGGGGGNGGTGGTGGIISDATGYTGGGADNLDGEATEDVTVPQIYFFKHSTLGWKQYLLRTGLDAESVPDIIHPDDFNASTNPKVFELMF